MEEQLTILNYKLERSQYTITSALDIGKRILFKAPDPDINFFKKLFDSVPNKVTCRPLSPDALVNCQDGRCTDKF